jgi:hypothetical protein
VRAAASFAVALLLTAPAAAVEQQRPWSVDVGATYVMLGDEHTTGGWTPTLAGRRWWSTSERARISAGITAVAFDFRSLHWLGFMAGPEVGGDYRLSRSWRAGGELALDGGRIPVCNAWHLCLRYWGVFPRARAGVTYEASPGVSMTAGLGVRYVNALGWSGVSWEPGATARFGW